MSRCVSTKPSLGAGKPFFTSTFLGLGEGDMDFLINPLPNGIPTRDPPRFFAKHDSSIPVCKASNGEVRCHFSRRHSEIERPRYPRASHPRDPTHWATARHRPAFSIH